MPSVRRFAHAPHRRPLLWSAGAAGVIWLTSCAALAWLYNSGVEAVRQQTESGLVRIACAAASSLDVRDHDAVLAEARQDGPAYRHVVEHLRRLVRYRSDIQDMYTMVLRDGKPVFVVDAAEPGDRDRDGVEDRAGLFEPYPQAAAELLATLADGRPRPEMRLIQDKWGAALSGYAPLRSDDGALKGIVGVDLSSEEYLGHLRRNRQAAVFGAAIAACIALGIAGFVFFLLRGRVEADRVRRCAEAALRLSESRYRTILENCRDVIFAYAPTGEITYVSESVQGYGYSPDEVVGRNFIEFVCPDDCPAVAEAFRRTIQEGLESDVSFRLRTKAGAWRHGEVSGKIVRDAQGRIEQVTGVLRDVTERAEMEERLRRGEKLESLGRLAGGVAHDFNNQLAIALGYAEILEPQLRNDPEQRKSLQRIADACQRSAELTRLLLAFARRDRRPRNSIPFDRIVRETAALLARTSPAHYRIRSEVREGLPPILGEDAALQNAVLNLGLNARDAMPDGGEIVFSLDRAELSAADAERLELSPGPFLRLEVQDTGAGIPPEILSRIFEPFFTTKAAGKGTGLGLAAVYGTAKTHHGAVEAANAPEGGALLRLWLPVGSGIGEPAPAAAAVDRPLRILLADDEEGVRSMTRGLLEARGHRVVVCANGLELLERYRFAAAETDLVITDWAMPGLDGRELLRRLRAIKAEVPILIITGFAAQVEAAEADGRGRHLVLGKPFDAARLGSAIAAALAPRKD